MPVHKQLKLILLILITAFSFQLMAHKTIVRGKITDAKTGETLPFVNLVFKNSKIGTSSDINGNYVLESYYPTDSLVATFIGYINSAQKVKKDIDQTINFKLETGDFQLQTVEIKYKGNPAHTILDRVERNKKANNREKYDYYKYEVYNKVEFDLNNITEEFKNKNSYMVQTRKLLPAQNPQ